MKLDADLEMQQVMVDNELASENRRAEHEGHRPIEGNLTVF